MLLFLDIMSWRNRTKAWNMSCVSSHKDTKKNVVLVFLLAFSPVPGVCVLDFTGSVLDLFVASSLW